MFVCQLVVGADPRWAYLRARALQQGSQVHQDFVDLVVSRATPSELVNNCGVVTVDLPGEPWEAGAEPVQRLVNGEEFEDIDMGARGPTTSKAH